MKFAMSVFPLDSTPMSHHFFSWSRQ